MSDNKHALIVVASPELSAPSALLPKLQAAAVHQVKLIRRTESEASQRAILLGLTLWRIKASMKGTFTGWLKDDFDSLGYRQARYYMSASLAFIEQTKATLPEFLALPGNQADLALDAMPEGKARTLMAKIEKFVGDRSLGELFDHLGIKDAGKKKHRTGSDDDGESDAPAAPADPAQCLYNEATEHLHALRITLTDDAALIQIKRKALLELNDSMTQLQKEFSAKVRTALGKTR
jgi:hypothetical protein